jgi:hypothetical protein
VLRNRLLEAQGFTVVSVPWFEWEALSTDRQRGAYLQAKVNAAAAAAASKRARRRG